MISAPTYVIGHLNPDTDSIASAIGYAWLLHSSGQEVLAARAGAPNQQTRWLLERLALSTPTLLTDAAPSFASVTRRLPVVAPQHSLGEALALSRAGSVVPLIGVDGKPAGLITGRGLLQLLTSLLASGLAESLSLQDLLGRPCREAAEEGLIFPAHRRISEARSQVLRDESDDFLVVAEDGAYLGICRKPDLLNPPRLRLILVDHNEPTQAVAHLDEAELIEVLDHHRLANPPTRLPIRFHIDPVGSTSTLVSERIEEAQRRPPAAIAGLLLGGILSDTLALRSPTTTPRDRRAADRLGSLAFAAGAPLQGERLSSFGAALLGAGASLGSRDAAELVSSDVKAYQAGQLRLLISQVEVTDFAPLEQRHQELDEALERLREQRGAGLAILMVTNVVAAGSRLLLRGELPLGQLPYRRCADGTLEARGVVSRKKQLLPLLLAMCEAS